jgi:hypothetical protein
MSGEERVPERVLERGERTAKRQFRIRRLRRTHSGMMYGEHECVVRSLLSENAQMWWWRRKPRNEGGFRGK